MEIEKALSFSTLTIAALTSLIQLNRSRAAALGLKFERANANGKMTSRVVCDREVVFEQVYAGGLIHEMVAQLHIDASHFFNGYDHKIKLEIRKIEEKQAAQKMLAEKRTMYEQAHPDFEVDPEAEV